MKSRQEQVWKALYDLFLLEYNMDEREADEATMLVVAEIKKVDRDRRKEARAESEARRIHRMKVNRDFARGVYSRWATNASHDPTWCDDCSNEIAVGGHMYMKVDHDKRDPELDIPHVRVFCETCAANHEGAT